MKHVPFDSCRIFRYLQPLRKPLPLKTVTLSHREGLILEMVDSQGRFHYGEASPLHDFSRESLSDALKQLKVTAGHFCEGMMPENLLYPSVAFAIESIQYSQGKSEWLHQRARQAPLLMGADDATLGRLDSWKQDWPDEFKLKVGRSDVGQDIDAIQQILDRIPSSIKLRLDANQRWSFKEAISFGMKVPVGRISYVEEPTEDCEDFPGLYQETGIGYALDETLQRPGFSLESTLGNRHTMAGGLRAIVLKPTLVGGLAKCLSLVDWACERKIRTVFSSSFESALGVSIIEQLCLEYAPKESPGLDTLSAFEKPGFCPLPDWGQPLPAELRNVMETVWSYRSAH
ncbi:o-succinylbenzoate synthase [Endozoicomonas arenosclerae]|uniref:o-succinylbenzoate synthase n=1 Tax=Endozoicomonas arenosclerae TaxID=1633495 RepID=UPI0007817B97|nr:o-succinylbenzoate synthase [Endozoicomonas arenosclerae]